MLALLLASFAVAATPVLVSSFQPETDDAVGLSALLEGYLAVALEDAEGVQLVRVEQTPPFEDYDARTYMDGCPRGDVVGCTTVVAQRGKVAYAVTGTVRVGEDGSVVDVVLLDLANSSIAVQFRTSVAQGDDRAFADAVVRVVVAAVQGEIGGAVDIRDDGEEAPARDNDAVAKQLRELQEELGSAEVELTRPDAPLPKTTYSTGDLAKDMEGEGLKPWERMRMGPAEYVRYKNSGLPLVEWRARAMGRRGQLVFRPSLGFANGPVDGGYYGAYAVDDSLATVDSWSAQSVQTGRGFEAGLAVAWGLTPYLEAGIAGGVTTGHFTVEVSQQKLGDPVEPTDPIRYQAGTWAVGPRVTAALFPVSPVRPVVGAGVDVSIGGASGQFITVPPELSTFSPAPLVLGRLVVGGEARISPRVDFFAHLPITLVAGGELAQSARIGTQQAVEPVVPDEAGPVGWALQLGLQVRLFGKDPQEQTLLDEIDEP